MDKKSEMQRFRSRLSFQIPTFIEENVIIKRDVSNKFFDTSHFLKLNPSGHMSPENQYLPAYQNITNQTVTTHPHAYIRNIETLDFIVNLYKNCFICKLF